MLLWYVLGRGWGWGGDNTIMGKKGPQTENCPLENIQDNLFHFKGLQFELDKKF